MRVIPAKDHLNGRALLDLLKAGIYNISLTHLMLDLTQIEQDLTQAMKAKDSLQVDVLRALKTRIQNEKISKGSDLDDQQISQLISSEVKRRKEAAEMYTNAGRTELADKEKSEIGVLQKYLPKQVEETEIQLKADLIIAEKGYTQADFGKLMGELKAHFGNTADGAVLAKIAKEKLK